MSEDIITNYECYSNVCNFSLHSLSSGNTRSIIAVPLSISALMLLASIATFTAGVVLLVRAKRVLHHSSQPPPPGTDHYEMVDREKRAPLDAGVYEEVDKQDTPTDRSTKHYQELNQAKMERGEYASLKAGRHTLMWSIEWNQLYSIVSVKQIREESVSFERIRTVGIYVALSKWVCSETRNFYMLIMLRTCSWWKLTSISYRKTRLKLLQYQFSKHLVIQHLLEYDCIG